MINLVVKKCFCGKARPTFGIKGKTPTHCVKCKLENMIDLYNKKCLCGKALPTFGISRGKRECCVKCKTDDMVNLIHRCMSNEDPYNFFVT